MKDQVNSVFSARSGESESPTSPTLSGSMKSESSRAQVRSRKRFQPLKRLTFATLAGLTGLVVSPLGAIAQAAPRAPQSLPAPPAGTVPPQTPPEAGTVPTQGETVTPPIPVIPPAPAVPPRRIPSRTNVPVQGSGSYQENTYTLGPGDTIGVDIFDVPEFSGANGRYTIMIDGSVTMPWIGRVKLQGLTLDQADSLVTSLYDQYIRDLPNVTVNLLSARSLQVAVVGEVKRPGAYPITPEGGSNRILVGEDGASGGVANQWPTVTRIIQTAGGITQLADLRKVEVRRSLSDGSTQVIAVNLYDLLRKGDLNQDVTLRDRDTIVIPTATALTAEDANLLGAASFAPETIRVNVVGEVAAPGTLELDPNITMNEAILAAGNFIPGRARKSRVELIRLNPNGTATRRTIEVDMSAGVNEQNNPPLRDGDSIIVGRSSRIRLGETIQTIVEPFTGIFGIFDTIDRIFSGDR
jgi:polysaccharide biosynthesis/export protein